MSAFTIEINGLAGTRIDTLAREAIRIANLLSITVMFQFNEVTCMARPGDDPELLAADALRLQSLPVGERPDYRLAVGYERSRA